MLIPFLPPSFHISSYLSSYYFASSHFSFFQHNGFFNIHFCFVLFCDYPSYWNTDWEDIERMTKRKNDIERMTNLDESVGSSTLKNTYIYIFIDLKHCKMAWVCTFSMYVCVEKIEVFDYCCCGIMSHRNVEENSRRTDALMCTHTCFVSYIDQE